MGYCKQFDELFEADSDHAAAVAAAAAGRYTFMCRQDDNASLSPVPDWYDLFHVNVLAYYKKLENDVLVLRSDESFFMAREYFLERSELLEIVFGSTLYYVDIPQAVEESIFDEVVRLARSMVVDSRVDEAFPALPKMYHEAVPEWAISQVIRGLERVALESCSVIPSVMRDLPGRYFGGESHAVLSYLSWILYLPKAEEEQLVSPMSLCHAAQLTSIDRRTCFGC